MLGLIMILELFWSSSWLAREEGRNSGRPRQLVGFEKYEARYSGVRGKSRQRNNNTTMQKSVSWRVYIYCRRCVRC